MAPGPARSAFGLPQRREGSDMGDVSGREAFCCSRYFPGLGFCRLPSSGHELLGGSEIYQGRARGEGRL